MTIDTHIHEFVPAQTPGTPTLLLLHGTGGDEQSLFPLAPRIAPGAAMLGVRGNVSEHGSNRYFRRIAEGVFDIDDLIARTQAFADFVLSASAYYGFAPSSLIAVGYSNGANIAASTLLLRPGVIQRAVLFRAMLPLEPEQPPALQGTQVLITAGRFDNLIPHESTDRLAEILRDSGADVTLSWQNVDHRLTQDDLHTAHQWIAHQTGAQKDG
ncbi:MAG: alpha/beta hydrolase [Anaerolineae bacterium]|nr:alpha/beta hydrolase [Anaerolineae bacterium]